MSIDAGHFAGLRVLPEGPCLALPRLREGGFVDAIVGDPQRVIGEFGVGQILIRKAGVGVEDGLFAQCLLNRLKPDERTFGDLNFAHLIGNLQIQHGRQIVGFHGIFLQCSNEIFRLFLGVIVGVKEVIRATRQPRFPHAVPVFNEFRIGVGNAAGGFGIRERDPAPFDDVLPNVSLPFRYIDAFHMLVGIGVEFFGAETDDCACD